ncbi:MAG: hypothetical protein WCF16_08770 [Alphaproteobacteria bacterium]
MRQINVIIALCAGLVALATAGCAGLQYQQALQIRQQAQAEAKVIEDRCNKNYSVPELDVIREKFPWNVKDITARHLIIEDVPSEAERNALLRFADLRTGCRKDVEAWTQRFAPYLLSAGVEFSYKTDQVLAQLLQGRITYGTANKLRQEAYQASIQEGTAAEKEYLQMSLAAREAELNRQAAQSAAMADAGIKLLQLSQPQVQRPAMTTTNCFWTGPTLNCTSF